MKNKRIFSNELAYIIGILTLTLGTALMEKANFGMSMVVAPAYVIYLKVSQTLQSYTFGTSEYVFQAGLLILLVIVLRRFKLSYLFSFVTAFIFGKSLDLMIPAVASLPADSYVWRGLWYIAGMVICAVGISMFFHTYVAPEAYELFVKEIAAGFGFDINRTKTVYDIISCLVGVVLSFIFFGFGHFEGVKLGTIFCALVNGRLIGFISRLLDSAFEFRDSFPLRKFFER